VTGALLSSSQNLAALVLVVIKSLEAVKAGHSTAPAATSLKTSTSTSTPLT